MKKLLKLQALLLVFFVQSTNAIEIDRISELELLFKSENYEAFFETAEKRAQEGDAEALFLLGKAHHLGKGVPENFNKAYDFYERAAKLNSAKAEHNIGVLVLDELKHPDQAVAHFKKALDMGLKHPTLHNLGRTYMSLCDRNTDPELCKLASEYHFRAWEERGEYDMLDNAVMGQVKACFIERDSVRRLGPEQARKPEHHCEQARALAEKGAALGSARAAYNRGAIEYFNNDYAAALPWFHLANERKLGKAAYTLGEINALGQGQAVNEEAALNYFKRAAELNDEQGYAFMRNYWREQTTATYDREKIRAAIVEYKKYDTKSDGPSEALGRLALIETLESNARQFPQLAKQPMQARFCPKGRSAISTDGRWLEENTRWRIFKIAKPEEANEPADTLPLLAQGLADAKGCLVFSKQDRSKLRDALAGGATLMINQPGARHLLNATVADREIALALGMEASY